MTAKTIFCAALLAVASWGQSYLGGVRGTVLDASGKSIGEVKVTLVDEMTALEATISDEKAKREPKVAVTTKKVAAKK